MPEANVIYFDEIPVYDIYSKPIMVVKEGVVYEYSIEGIKDASIEKVF